MKSLFNLKKYLQKYLLIFIVFSVFIENTQAQIIFSPAPASPFSTIGVTGGSERRMKSADFNKDGIQDVVVSTSAPIGAPLKNLAVVLGTYAGAMTAAPDLYGVPTATPTPLGATA